MRLVLLQHVLPSSLACCLTHRASNKFIVQHIGVYNHIREECEKAYIYTTCIHTSKISMDPKPFDQLPYKQHASVKRLRALKDRRRSVKILIIIIINDSNIT